MRRYDRAPYRARYHYYGGYRTYDSFLFAPLVFPPVVAPDVVIVHESRDRPAPEPRAEARAPREGEVIAVRRAPRPRRFGLHLTLSGTLGDDVRMGGFVTAFRFRPIPLLALDLGAGIYGGRDYYNDPRAEIPITLDALVFLLPHSRFSPYVVAGVGVSYARVNRKIRTSSGPIDDYHDFTYAGGSLGAGLELRIARPFAINVEARGFLRTRIDDNRDVDPEFVGDDGRTTNTSGGGLVNLGMTFYF